MMVIDILMGLGLAVLGVVCWAAGVKYGRLTTRK
jgi:hypothetical protein